MLSSTTQKQPAATIIEEGSVSLGKTDKIKEYNEEGMVVFFETKKTFLQESLEMVGNLATTNHNIHRTAIQISKALASLGGTKQLWKQVKKNHSTRLYKEHKDKVLSQQQQEELEEQQPENDENEANSIGSVEDTLRMTSPVAIVRVLRDDISNYLLYNSLKQAAMDATTTVSNVSALVRMTLLSLAQQNISIIKRDDVQLEKEKSGFNITKILPKSFTIRNKELLNNINKIMVAHPNLALKDQLDKLYKPNTRAKDLQEICTNAHLQFIQSHHLGNKKDNNNDTIHPLWADLVFKKFNLGGKKFRSTHYHSMANGKKKKTSHGALIYTNPDCPAVKAGYTTFNRDSVGATGIGLAGATTLLSPDRITLPPLPQHNQLQPVNSNWMKNLVWFRHHSVRMVQVRHPLLFMDHLRALLFFPFPQFIP
ncbi:hypothetical protein BDC45DRAFT_574265 [Circinella umbellata]|nr:hypothetical protein BDC45DRAFT_574265 [Circinella umbellata]